MMTMDPEEVITVTPTDLSEGTSSKEIRTVNQKAVVEAIRDPIGDVIERKTTVILTGS